MQALIVIDAQNEFSSGGKRPVPNHSAAIEVIRQRVVRARIQGRPIAWVRHFNRPEESPAFVPGSWGAEFTAGFGPELGGPRGAERPALEVSGEVALEKEFQKNVYGAFTGTAIGAWLRAMGVDEILLVGFYTHGCVATTAREAIMAGLGVVLDPDATGACDIVHEILGRQTADEVRRSALLHLVNMGANIQRIETGQLTDTR